MNPIVLKFADGTFFFVGLTAVCLSALVLLCSQKGLLSRALTIIVLIGIAFVIISATPLPLWVYALWLISVTVCMVTANLAKSSDRSRIAAGVLLLAATVGLVLIEAPYHFSPNIAVPNGRTVYVLGDSISAGMGTGERCWPDVLKDRTGLAVVNLALAGATAQSAMKQAKGITQPNSLIFVEIGGNDLLGTTEAGAFRNQLDSLIGSLRSSQHDVIMFELPLLPLQNAFGRAQRDIAIKHGVRLLPKRVLTTVLGIGGATLDGLHLSQEGHNELATIVGRSLVSLGQ